MKPPREDLEAFELSIIGAASYFTTFYQIGRARVRHEHRSYGEAKRDVAEIWTTLARPAWIYAVTKDGRATVVTPRLAELSGLNKPTGKRKSKK